MRNPPVEDNPARIPGTAEDRARFWEAEYASLLESFPDAVFTLDLAGNLITMNAAAERLSGFRRTEVPGTNIRQLLTSESYVAVVQDAIADDQPFSGEAELLTRGGVIVPVEIHITIRRNQGRPLGIQYIARDTTTRKRSTDALRLSELQFRLMAKNLTDMVLAYDMDRRLVFANPAAQNLTGYSVAELEDAQFICWIHPDDRDRMLGYWDRLFEGKSFHEEQYRLTTKDGRLKWIEASWGPILDETGTQIGVQGRERDITERKLAAENLLQTEQRLRVDEEHYRTLFENSPFPMWEEDFSVVKAYIDSLAAAGITDFRSYLAIHPEAADECLKRVKVIDVNRAAREFYGAVSKEELLSNLSGIFDEAAYENFRDEIATLAETNSTFQSEFETRILNGEERTVSMIVSLVGAPTSDWSRAILSFFDITDRKRLEQQFVQSQKLESLGRLAGGVAHDFNNLLTVINGYSELLLQGLDEGHPFREGLSQIRNAGVRGAELTQQLLAFGRKQISQPHTFSLNALITETQPMLRRVIGENIDLRISLAPELGTVKADRSQMHQVLMNLTVNGQEAMPGGGELTIETRNVWRGESICDTPGEPGAKPYTLLRIRDTGVGMDDRTKKYLFEPFFSTKGVGRGAGLGLATVFGIVAQSDGHISVESEPGKGATFNVYLPCVEGPLTADTPPASRREEYGGFGASLIVEDQEEVRRLVSHLMIGLGFEVFTAAGGSEALGIAASLPGLRLLLTDVVMPGMNGRELAEALTKARPELKVIFMSGYTGQVMDHEGMLPGVAYLQKPFTRETLIRALRQVMG